MPRIKQLPVHEAHKIAAGQVVERPANVVKELVENAIDAQATQITIYIEHAGKQLIRIADNGVGMDAQDAHLCFHHHATSKISSIDDLSFIQTFGFRGEALSSIAAVSIVELVTKDADSPQGISLTLENGIVTKEEQCTRTNGTDIAVKNLFYNIPARKKFLKTDDTEWRQINTLFQAFCFDYPQIHFKLLHNDLMVHNCPPVNAPIERVAQLWDATMTSHLLPLNAQEKKQEFSITGFISHHHYARYDRSQIFFFVNSRWVKNNTLSKALIKGYLNVLPADRYPAACVFIEIDQTQIDINIDPRKEEVKFLHPRRVETTLQELVKSTLESGLTARIKKETTHLYPTFNFDAPAFAEIPELQKLEPFKPTSIDSLFNAPPLHTPVTQNHKPISSTPETAQTKVTIDELETSFTILGQYHKTYILLEQSDGLFLIDQHAAHERILYEQFAHRIHTQTTTTLLFPEIITVTQEALATIEPHLAILQECGIGIELFGDNQLIIQSTPIQAKNISYEQLVHTLIGWINEYKELNHATLKKTLHEKVHAQMACKAAVKAGDVLSAEHMHTLIQDLQKTTNRFSCPHGRPTGWLLSLYEIEKKFKRKL
jgi:DNA mismatch repair protein MutL